LTRCFAALLTASLMLAGASAPADSLRVGLVSFGTAAWEIDTLRRHGLDRDLGVTLETVELADPAAGEVALQAGGVDAIVTDWLWVSRQRHAGQRVVFVPHSAAIGEILVPAGSPLTKLSDLPGRHLGVAGGPLDKSWLLLRAYSRQAMGGDIAETAQAQFAAPPLLSQELAKGRLDAVLTFWPFAARLEAQGFRRLASMTEVMAALGFAQPVPMLGYAFREQWIGPHAEAARRFMAALDQADRLMSDPAEWDRLKPLTGAPDQATLAALRQRFLAGLVSDRAGAAPASARLYALLASIGGPGLTGGAPALAPGTFWGDGPS
jgi:NitT/TauT family transport system substrate-binding protein